MGSSGALLEKRQRGGVARRVDGDEVGERRGQFWGVLERRPRADREAADSAVQRAGAMRRVGDDREHGLAGGDEIREQTRDPAAARVAGGGNRGVVAGGDERAGPAAGAERAGSAVRDERAGP